MILWDLILTSNTINSLPVCCSTKSKALLQKGCILLFGLIFILFRIKLIFGRQARFDIHCPVTVFVDLCFAFVFHVKTSQSAKNWLNPARNENWPKR